MEPHLRRGAAALAAAALALAACGGSGRQGSPTPGPGGRGTVAIGPTSQYDILHRAPLRLLIRAPAAGSLSLAVTVRDGVGAPRPLSSPLQVSGGSRQTVTLTPSQDAVQPLTGCRPLRLQAALSQSDHVVASTQRVLAPAAPDCARFFAPGSVWNRPLPDNAPVDPRSGSYATQLRQQVDHGFAVNFYPNINTTSYSTPIYTVAAGQRRVPVKMVGRGAAHYAAAIRHDMAQGVPIPPGAKPAAGTDRHMVIWQPATDTMWELWKATEDHGAWTAEWGGKMTQVSSSQGFFHAPGGTEPGATATSLPLVGGLITLADLRRGSIDHALAMAIPQSRYGVWSLPAQRTDGNVHSVDAIPAGARFRLDPKLNVDALHLPPFTAMLARAAQRYGILVRDTSAVVTFYAQDPTPTGSDPWQSAFTPSRADVMRRFPWDHLQVLRTTLYTYSGKRVSQ